MAQVLETAVRPSDGMIRKAIFAAAVGNFVEWFDYGIYGFLAGTLAQVFFPAGDPATQVISSIGVFGLGFIIRPLGGIYFGAEADKRGRRPVLVLTVLLMSGATTLIGLLPPFSAVGLWAPVLLLLLRFVQGLGAGGEIGSAMVIVSEYASPARRGFAGSMIQFASFIAFVVGAVLVLVMTAVLPAPSLAAWGWRIPFLLALPLGLLGLYVRMEIEETPQFQDLRLKAKVSPAPNREVIRKAMPAMFVVAGLTATTAIGLWMLVTYMTSYLSGTLGFSGTRAILVTTTGVVAACIATPLGGLASDRWGRRRMLVVSTALLALLAYPCFLLFASGPIGLAIAGIVLFGALVGLFDGGFTATMAELFETRYRVAGISLPYNIAAALFGGGVPFASATLVQLTGNRQMGALLVIIGALLSLAAAVGILRAVRGTFLAGLPIEANDAG